jgi:uncharacterized protein YlxW (UPF0749 family)
MPPDPRETHALLDTIAARALDDDYHADRGGPQRFGSGRKLSFGFTLAVIGAVLATAAVGLRQQNSGAELERQALVKDVTRSQHDQERSEAILAQLRADVATLQRRRGVDVPATDDLGLVTGALGAAGPGVAVRVDNGRGPDGVVSDTDLQLLVNGLWYAGAEAVSVDGERVGSLTSIRSAGHAITVNFRSIRTPYDVLAIGDSEAVITRFTQSPTGRFWESRHRQAHVRFDMVASPDVVVPAVPQRRLSVSHAQLLSEPGGEEGSRS